MASKQQQVSEALASRMVALLTPLSPEDRSEAMDEIESLMESSGLSLTRTSSSPAMFAAQVFRESSPLVTAAIEQRLNPANVELPVELVSRLLPSDHHLD